MRPWATSPNGLGLRFRRSGAMSIIYFLIILLLCFILYNWMQRAGTTGGVDEEHPHA